MAPPGAFRSRWFPGPHRYVVDEPHRAAVIEHVGRELRSAMGENCARWATAPGWQNEPAPLLYEKDEGGAQP